MPSPENSVSDTVSPANTVRVGPGFVSEPDVVPQPAGARTLPKRVKLAAWTAGGRRIVKGVLSRKNAVVRRMMVVRGFRA